METDRISKLPDVGDLLVRFQRDNPEKYLIAKVIAKKPGYVQLKVEEEHNLSNDFLQCSLGIRDITRPFTKELHVLACYWRLLRRKRFLIFKRKGETE